MDAIPLHAGSRLGWPLHARWRVPLVRRSLRCMASQGVWRVAVIDIGCAAAALDARAGRGVTGSLGSMHDRTRSRTHPAGEAHDATGGGAEHLLKMRKRASLENATPRPYPVNDCETTERRVYGVLMAAAWTAGDGTAGAVSGMGGPTRKAQPYPDARRGQAAASPRRASSGRRQSAVARS